MSLTTAQVIEAAGAPLVCTSPLLTMPTFENIVHGNSDAMAIWTIGATPVNAAELVLGGTGVFSIQVYCSNPAGGSLTIETEPFGVTPFVWDTLLTTNIIGQSAPANPNVPNFIGPIELPGWIFRVHLFNLAAVDAGFTGILIAKGH